MDPLEAAGRLVEREVNAVAQRAAVATGIGMEAAITAAEALKARGITAPFGTLHMIAQKAAGMLMAETEAAAARLGIRAAHVPAALGNSTGFAETIAGEIVAAVTAGMETRRRQAETAAAGAMHYDRPLG